MIPREIIFDVQESTQCGYEARAVGYPIFTQADSLDELKTMLQDAVSCHFGPGEEHVLIRLHML
jgi:hypothetical protein